jgi:hypothetical protein
MVREQKPRKKWYQPLTTAIFMSSISVNDLYEITKLRKLVSRIQP